MADAAWPALPLEGWRDTYTTLHLWSQVVGKVALAQAPPLNHSWGIAFHLTPRGFSTLLLPYGERTFAIEFDFIGHELVVTTSAGERRTLPLRPQTVADFYAAVMALLCDLGMPIRIWPVSVEMASAIRIDQDVEHRSYDADAANRFWRITTSIARVLSEERCRFVGKSSPVHFFWGGFDLAWTRFSGRPAPPRDGPVFMQEAYSQEVVSHGFWPGSMSVQETAFYSYAVPEPAGFKTTNVRPDGAYYHHEMGEFILPYDAVRTSASPDKALRDFVRSTYAAAAALGHWDRAALERQPKT
jgi:hypothetical protein